jgi:hypothetical protein
LNNITVIPIPDSLEPRRESTALGGGDGCSLRERYDTEMTKIHGN